MSRGSGIPKQAKQYAVRRGFCDSSTATRPSAPANTDSPGGTPSRPGMDQAGPKYTWQPPPHLHHPHAPMTFFLGWGIFRHFDPWSRIHHHSRGERRGNQVQNQQILGAPLVDPPPPPPRGGGGGSAHCRGSWGRGRHQGRGRWGAATPTTPSTPIAPATPNAPPTPCYPTTPVWRIAEYTRRDDADTAGALNIPWQ